MALYNANFNYLEKNSEEMGFVVSAFDTDSGFKDTFLSMEPVYEESRRGEFRFDYGARYNANAVVEITIIKADRTDFSILDVRNTLKWLTGSVTNSWLNIYSGDDFQYAFLGRFTDVKQQKLDGRTIGLMAIFTSVSPWAFSEEKSLKNVMTKILTLEVKGNDCIVVKSNGAMSVTNGVLCNGGGFDDPSSFDILSDGTVCMNADGIVADVNNQSDDVYTYLNLNVSFENNGCTYLEIENKTLNEITRVVKLYSKDKIEICDKQFIVAYTYDNVSKTWKNQNRIFGDDFNFVWPRLAPGKNEIFIRGDADGEVTFYYRYPIKIGDCTIDV